MYEQIILGKISSDFLYKKKQFKINCILPEITVYYFILLIGEILNFNLVKICLYFIISIDSI